MSARDEKPLSDLEKALAALRPAAANVDRDRLMFEAGRAARQPRGPLVWLVAAGGPTLVAACLGLALWFDLRPPAQIITVTAPVAIVPPAPAPVEQQPAPPAAEPETPPAAPPPHSYGQLRELVLRHGADALPEPPPMPPMPGAAPRPLTAADWRTAGGSISSFNDSGVD